VLIGAIAGVLAFASAPVSSAPTPLPPTPAPLSDKLTVIMCGAVLGESFQATRARLGEPASKTTLIDGEYFVYRVDSGAADCMFRLVQGRVAEIYARLNSNQPDPKTVDPYGVSLGTLYDDLIGKRGAARAEPDSEAPIFPSSSGACWAYVLGQGHARHDVIVTGIRVFLNINNPGLDCFSR
jgi:hypothetical protein